MVSEYYEIPAFNEITKVLYSQVQGQELTVKGAVFLLGDSQMAIEESERLPATIDLLFKYCAHCCT